MGMRWTVPLLSTFVLRMKMHKVTYHVAGEDEDEFIERVALFHEEPTQAEAKDFYIVHVEKHIDVVGKITATLTVHEDV